METVMKPFLDLLREIYIGSEAGQSWIIDRIPGHGITAAINEITAEEASKPLVRGGSTIAAHTEHLRWSLEFAMTFYKGEQPSGKWEESWLIRKVNAQEWEDLRQSVLRTYQELTKALSGVEDWSDPDLLKGTMALLPHAAYHLGAIKQLLIAAREHKL